MRTTTQSHRAPMLRSSSPLAAPVSVAFPSRPCARGCFAPCSLQQATRTGALRPLRGGIGRHGSSSGIGRRRRQTRASSSSTSTSGNGSSSNGKEKLYDAVALGNICVDIFVPVDEIPPTSVVKTHETLRRLQSIVEASSLSSGGVDGTLGDGGSGGRGPSPPPSSSSSSTATATKAATASVVSPSPASAVPTRLELGGNANFLIAASRLGLRAAAVAHVGDDEAGAFAASELEREGVSVMRPPLLDAEEALGSEDGERSTLVCYVLTHAETASHAFCSRYDLGPHPLLLSSTPSRSSSETDGEEGASSFPSSSTHPLLPRAAIEVLSSTKAVFVNGFAFDELPHGTVLEALRAASDAGALVFFDPGPRVAAMLSAEADAGSPSPSGGFYSTALEAALDASDVVLLTEEEAEAATGLRVAGLSSDAAAEAGRAIMLHDYERRGGEGGGERERGSRRKEGQETRRRTRAVVVKRGARGAVVVARGEGGGGRSPSSSFFERGAPRVDVVDTVGCGDSFAAAFVLASVSGKGETPTPLPVALALANAVGAATASSAGAGRAVASPEKVESLLEADAEKGDEDARAALELLRASRRRRGGGRE